MAFRKESDSHCCYRFCGCTCDRKTLGCSTFWILLVIGIIIMIALLAVSIKDVDHDEFALAYNTVTRSLGSEILSEGRHTLTPGEELKTFDNKIITRDEDIECVSKDGLIVRFTVVTQYRINRPDARTILYEWGDQGGLFAAVDYPIRDTAKDVCAMFTGEEFFTGRGQVEQDLSANTTFVLRTSNTRVTPTFTQLKNINLPSAFSAAIQAKQLALEDVDVANNERAEKIINAQTDLLKAEQDALIVLDQARAQGNGHTARATEQANIRASLWTERRAAVLFGTQQYNMTAADLVNNVLLPGLYSRAQSPSTQACLQQCTASGSTDCWWCYVGGVTPAVTV